MNLQITLTGEQKIMNMAKLGTVAQSKSGLAKGANPRKHRAGGMTCYTLCEYQGKAKRNSSRHSFAFDILPISRNGCPPRWPLAADLEGDVLLQYGFHVIPVQSLMDGTPKTTLKTSLSLTAGGFPIFSPQKTTVPPCSMGFRPVSAEFGGCHD